MQVLTKNKGRLIVLLICLCLSPLVGLAIGADHGKRIRNHFTRWPLLVYYLIFDGHHSGPTSRRCYANLRQISQGLSMYTQDFDDRLPASFDSLYPDYVSDPRTFVCPADTEAPEELKRMGADAGLVRELLAQGKSSYEYIGGYHSSSNEDPAIAAQTVIAFDSAFRHTLFDVKMANVLFANGHIEPMARDRLLNLLQNMTSFQNISLDGKKRLWKLINKIERSSETK